MQTVPTEPGYYWWRHEKSPKWEIVKVFITPAQTFGMWFIGVERGHKIEEVSGVFGPRITSMENVDEA